MPKIGNAARKEQKQCRLYKEEPTMHKATRLAAAACALTLVYAGEAAAILSNMTGFIQPKGGKVVGPLVITSMQCAVDSASVQRCYVIYNSTQASNVWISVDDFQG